MDSNLATIAIAALTFLVAIVFGTQHGGLLAWFRRLRGKKTKPTSTSPPTEGLVVQSSPAQTQAEAIPVKPTPTIGEVLAAKNFPRAARWADSLPVLLYALGWLAWAAGLLLMLLSTIVGGLGGALSDVSIKLSFSALFFMAFANLSPMIVGFVVVAIQSIRQLRL